MQGGRFISEDKKRKEFIGVLRVWFVCDSSGLWIISGEHIERYAAEVKSERMDDL